MACALTPEVGLSHVSRFRLWLRSVLLHSREISYIQNSAATKIRAMLL